MASGKVFAISFAINAMLGAGFSSAMKQGAGGMEQLKVKAFELHNEQKRLEKAWRESQARANAYQAKMQSLYRQFSAGKIESGMFRSETARLSREMEQSCMSAKMYSDSMKRLQMEMGKTAQTAANLSKAQVAKDRFRGSVGNFAATTATVAGAASPFLGALETAAQFERSMSKVKAITKANDEEIKRLTQTARELGETTQFSASQASEAMSYLGMAGWKTNDIIAGMPGLLNLAAAGGTDLARTADIVSDALTAFGLEAGQAGHMADVFAVTITSTNTNVEMLGDTMKYAAPVAKAFGVSMEETSAIAGLMANSGIKASQAGTALRAGFLRLAGPPKMAATAMDRLGISLSDVSVAQKETAIGLEALGISMSDTNGPRKMSAILRELQAKTADLGKEEKLAALKMIFGSEAATGWLAVLDAGPEALDKLTTELEKSNGAAGEMAKIMTDNAIGAINRFTSASESAAISVGSQFLPLLAASADRLANEVAWLSKVAEKHKTLTQWTVILAGGIGGLVVAAAGIQVVAATVGLLSGAYAILHVWQTRAASSAIVMKTVQLASAAATGVMTAAQWALNAAMSANPIGLVIVAIGLLIAAGVALYHNWDTITEKCGEMYEYVSQKWESLKQILSSPIQAAVNYVRTGSVKSGTPEAIATNAAGGIYKQGAFLTTFAETSPEAAIPLNGTKRAVGLWQKAGDIMGLTSPQPAQTNISLSIPVTVNGAADSETAQTLQQRVKAAVEEAMQNIQQQRGRVSFA